MTGGFRHDGDGVAGHVEEFDTPAFLFAGNGVPVHDGANVAGPKIVGRQIDGQNHVSEKFGVHI